MTRIDHWRCPCLPVGPPDFALLQAALIASEPYPPYHPAVVTDPGRRILLGPLSTLRPHELWPLVQPGALSASSASSVSSASAMHFHDTHTFQVDTPGLGLFAPPFPARRSPVHVHIVSPTGERGPEVYRTAHEEPRRGD